MSRPSGFTRQDVKALHDNAHVLTDRTPNGLRQRILEVFCSEENIKYLRTLFKKMLMRGKSLDYILAHLDEDVVSFANGERSGPGGDLIDSDPLARRGYASNSTSLWREIKKLNTAFYDNRLKFVKDFRIYLEGKSANLPEEDTEPYEMRMFEADSLRPPGLEFLNDPGPNYEILENQYMRKPMYYQWQDIPSGCGKGSFMIQYDKKTDSIIPIKPSPPFPNYYQYTPPRYVDKKEGFVSGKQTKKEGFNINASKIVPAADLPFVKPRTGIDPEDLEWDVGRANRTQEQALAEYYGTENCTSSEVIIDQTKIGYGGMAGSQTYGDAFAWGKNFLANGGSRFNRIQSIPFYQDTSSHPYERDIDETLTQGVVLETDNQVRRWADIERLRINNAEQYRFNGPLQNSRP